MILTQFARTVHSILLIEVKLQSRLSNYCYFHIANFHVRVTAMGTKAAAKQSESLGYYEPLNEFTHNFPAWRLVSNHTKRYLYRYIHGKWFIGKTLGKDFANIISKTISDSPVAPALEWLYWDGIWGDDDSLQVSRG